MPSKIGWNWIIAGRCSARSRLDLYQHLQWSVESVEQSTEGVDQARTVSLGSACKAESAGRDHDRIRVAVPEHCWRSIDHPNGAQAQSAHQLATMATSGNASCVPSSEASRPPSSVSATATVAAPQRPGRRFKRSDQLSFQTTRCVRATKAAVSVSQPSTGRPRQRPHARVAPPSKTIAQAAALKGTAAQIDDHNAKAPSKASTT